MESLHHFTYAEKLPLYRKLYRSLKKGGVFVLTDYFARTDGEEKEARAELLRLRALQGLPDGEFYHYDTPLTAEHETACLREAGFSSVRVLARWGQSYTIRTEKEK